MIQLYEELHPPKPGSDESFILNAYRQAKYTILQKKSVVVGAGLQCKDIFANEYLFLMDVNMSHNVHRGSDLLATRIIPFGGYWVTGGAGLPITLKTLARISHR